MPEPKEGPFWPDEPPRLTDDQLVEFTGDMVAGRLFTSRDLPGYEEGGPAFSTEFGSTWPFFALALETYGAPPDSYTKATGLFWSYRSDAYGVRSDGSPTYFIQIPRALHREDWLIVSEAIERASDTTFGLSKAAYRAIHRACHALYRTGRWKGGPNALANLTPQLVVENLSADLLREEGAIPETVGEIERWTEAAELELKYLQGEVGSYVRSRREIVALLEHVEAAIERVMTQSSVPPLRHAVLTARAEVLKWVLGQAANAGSSVGEPK